MPVIKIGQGSISIEKGQSVKDIVSMLKDNREKAKELGVNNIIEQVIAAELDGVLSDLSKKPESDAVLVFLTSADEKGLNILRHSASHIMAQAVTRLYPGARFGVGPTIKDGFYYDIEIDGVQLTDADLPKIEEEMEKIKEESIEFKREEMSKKDAIKLFEKMGQKYKVELINDIKDETVSIYRQGEFTDLCRGPHLPYTRKLGAFKLLNVSGAYWRGSEMNPMLTRIYGTAFGSKDALKAHLTKIEEAKKRDHRVLGKQLELFHLEDENPGQVYWKPAGWTIYVQLVDYMRKKMRDKGYVEVHTPSVMPKVLWEKSGHWDNYKNNMFITESEKREFAIKPMNCPGHIQLFKQGMKSYRDLPLRMAEFGSCCRNEVSGALHGILRVRGFVQDDAHIFCTENHIDNEVALFCNFLREVYTDFGFALDRIKVLLSTRPEHRAGSDETWDKAEEALGKACKGAGFDYKINPGEGAFYGPKLEFILVDALDREWQCGTIQLDYMLPSAERLDAQYVGEDGQKHNCVMLHRAILGSLERFIGILIEHFGGKFPLWLSPVQAAILPVSDKFNEQARILEKQLRDSGIRVETDASPEKLGYKIRQAQMQKVPYMLVLGEKEIADQTVSVRHREKGDLGPQKTPDFIRNLLEENSKRI